MICWKDGKVDRAATFGVICSGALSPSQADKLADVQDDLAALVERLQMAVKDYDEAVARPPARDLSNDWMMADVAIAHGHVFAQAKAAIESLAAHQTALIETLRIEQDRTGRYLERATRAEAERDALRQLVVEVLDDLAEAKWSMGTDWVSRAQAASGSSHN